MSTKEASEVHALWNCTACQWVRENVVEFQEGRDWIQWGSFEKDAKPIHKCREKGHPFLRSLVWFNP